MSQTEYFSVRSHIKINVEALNENETVPSLAELDQNIPLSFKIASQCASVDASIERDIQFLHHEDGDALLNYLRAQNEKINLLLSFMLSQQDDPNLRYQTETFGASGLTFISKVAFIKDTAVRLKLFIESPPTAIFCYGLVYGCKEKNGKFAVGIKYIRLKEEDKDVLIRAALHQQQKLLRQRALERHH